MTTWLVIPSGLIKNDANWWASYKISQKGERVGLPPIGYLQLRKI